MNAVKIILLRIDLGCYTVRSCLHFPLVIFLILVIKSGLGKRFGKAFKASQLGRPVSTKTRCSSWCFKEVANALIAQWAKATGIKLFAVHCGYQKPLSKARSGRGHIFLFPKWQSEMFRFFFSSLKTEQESSLWHYMSKKERALCRSLLLAHESKREDVLGKLLRILLSDRFGNTWKLLVVRMEVLGSDRKGSASWP